MRLLLVDDQVLFVESLKTVLSIIATDIEIIGIAHDGLEAVRWLDREQPDIILMDVRMPHMDGVEAAKEILSRHKYIKIMMLTTYDDDEYVEEAMKYGASGYVLKDVPPADLVNSVRAIMAGTIQMSPKILNRIMEHGDGERRGKQEHRVSLENIDLLSKREQEILFLMSRGFDNQNISEKLFIAEQTVKNHISKIYSKLGNHDRMTVLKLAREAGLEEYHQYLL